MTVPRGAYPAKRAAALSGVPLSTIHWWARHDVLVPSVSPERVKLWSYADLMGLRIIYWLRKTKEAPDGVAVRATQMPVVRRALAQIAELDLALWSEATGPVVRVDRAGNVHIVVDQGSESVEGQRDLDADELLSVTDPFVAVEGPRGPDLHKPRPHLRIVPGKLGGAPHIVGTRLESEAIGALRTSGLPEATIQRLYPETNAGSISDALDLEHQLAGNLRFAVAAG